MVKDGVDKHEVQTKNLKNLNEEAFYYFYFVF